jgi:hypothetical protein
MARITSFERWDQTIVICCPENRFLSFTAENVKNHRKGILT